MGDRIDSSLFQRQCALSNHPRDGDDEHDPTTVVTILGIGGKRPVGESAGVRASTYRDTNGETNKQALPHQIPTTAPATRS